MTRQIFEPARSKMREYTIDDYRSRSGVPRIFTEAEKQILVEKVQEYIDAKIPSSRNLPYGWEGLQKVFETETKFLRMELRCAETLLLGGSLTFF